MASRFLIYGLIDPRDGQLRYVGKSTTGLKRPRAQWKRTASGFECGHKANWIRSLQAEGVWYEIEVLEEHERAEDLPEAEQFWIAYFRSIGCRLTNLTAGGDGIWGLRRGLTTKYKMSAARGGLDEVSQKQVCEAYSGGLSMRAVGDRFGIKSNTVLHILKRHKICIRSKSQAHARPLTNTQIGELVAGYRDGRTAPELAARFCIRTTSVYRFLEQRGVSRRTRWGVKNHG